VINSPTVLSHHRTYRSVYGGSADNTVESGLCLALLVCAETYSALLLYLGVPPLLQTGSPISGLSASKLV